MKERRIGTFTLGAMLVVYGILFVINIFTDKLNYGTIFSLWPILLIILGIEILVGLYSKEKTKFVYDKGSVILLIMITIFILVAASAEWCMTKGIKYADRYYEEYVSREEDYVDGKAMFKNVEEITVFIDDEEKCYIQGKEKDKIVKELRDYDWNSHIVRKKKRGDSNILLDFNNGMATVCLSRESKNVYLHSEEMYANEIDKEIYEDIFKIIDKKEK